MARPSTKKHSFASFVPSLQSLRMIAIGTFWAAAIVGIGIGVARGVPRLRALAEARTVIDPATMRVTFVGVPAWMPAGTVDTLGDAARIAMGSVGPNVAGSSVSALNGDALIVVHHQMLASGWFERVEQVRRSALDEITIVGEFRTPFAMVRVGEDDHLIDVRGLRLPLAYSNTSSLAGARPALPLIVGVAMPKPAEPGTPWLGTDVRAAINLAKLLRDRPWFASGQVRSIDVSRFKNERLLELVTDRGTRVVWGSDPNDRSLGEMPAERKLACLDALYRDAKRIDDASGRTLDLRFDVVTLAPTSSAAQDIPSTLTASAP